MLKNSIKKIASILVLVTLSTTLTVNAATSRPRITPKPTTTTTTATTTVNIKDFGAHSIDETGYSKFDSSAAINKAIQSAKTNGSVAVDFGSGRFYATDISLESNIKYFSTQKAELIASPTTQVWHSVLTADNKTNITIDGLTVNGNKDVISGNDQSGSMLITLSTCSNVTINNCYLYNNWYLAILLQNSCNYINVTNNKIYDTDCGIATAHAASNNLLISGNTIYGNVNQMSEPIAIYNSNINGLAHDITITNNIVHDKLNASGILVMNATKVLIKGNTAYNLCQGITVGLDSFMSGTSVTTSTDVTITENIIYNCTNGILGEVTNSTVSNNKISNLKGMGIDLLTRNTATLISNNMITGNTITNINSLGAQEPAIRLENTTNSTVDKNIVSDTRATVLHWFAIQVTGQNCNTNFVQNNTSLGSVVKNSYPIYVQDAKKTTIQNNTGKILDLGIGTILLNNII